MTDCAITLLPSNTCSHCTKPVGTKWIEKEVAPGYSAPIHYIGDNTVPSLEAFPPTLPAVEVTPKDTAKWGKTTIVVRSVPRPRNYHFYNTSKPGGYIEGGWMDNEAPDVDLLDQPVEDTWF